MFIDYFSGSARAIGLVSECVQIITSELNDLWYTHLAHWFNWIIVIYQK